VIRVGGGNAGDGVSRASPELVIRVGGGNAGDGIHPSEGEVATFEP
jgi:hypothetical protein